MSAPRVYHVAVYRNVVTERAGYYAVVRERPAVSAWNSAPASAGGAAIRELLEVLAAEDPTRDDVEIRVVKTDAYPAVPRVEFDVRAAPDDVSDGPTSLEAWQAEIDARWGSSDYNAAYRADQAVVRDMRHALTHVQIAAGELARVVDAFEHEADTAAVAAMKRFGTENRLADAWFSLLRVASRYPSGAIDAQAACAARLAAKFPPRKGGA